MVSYYVENSSGVAVTIFPCDFGKYNPDDIKVFNDADFVSTDSSSENDDTLQYSFEDVCMCPSFDCEFFYLFGDSDVVETFVGNLDKRLYRNIIRGGNFSSRTSSQIHHEQIQSFRDCENIRIIGVYTMLKTIFI